MLGARRLDSSHAAEAVCRAARQLTREGRIVLIEMLGGSPREDESLDAEVLAEAEWRWAEIEFGTAKSSSPAELDQELRAKYQWP